MTMTSVGRDNLVRRLAGQNSSVDRKIPKTGGRGKPLPYGINGETSRNGGRAATECRPYGVFNSPIWSSAAGSMRENCIFRQVRPPAPAGQR